MTLIDVIAEHAFACSSPRSYVAMFHLKGAVSRVADGVSAFGNRQASHAITLDGVWRPGEDFGDLGTPLGRGGSSPPSAASAKASTSTSSAATKAPTGSARLYGDSVYDRLVDVKTSVRPR